MTPIQSILAALSNGPELAEDVANLISGIINDFKGNQGLTPAQLLANAQANLTAAAAESATIDAAKP